MAIDTLNDSGVTPSQGGQVRQHSKFWFDDGTMIIRAHEDGSDIVFKVHKGLFIRQFRLPEGTTSGSPDLNSKNAAYGLPVWDIPTELGVQVQDLSALLEHLYHDSPLSSDSPFSHLSSIVRASSPQQLNFPTIHELAKKYIVSMFPSGPSPFTHPAYLEEALALATEYRISSIRKGLFYSLVTTSDFEVDDPQTTASSAIPTNVEPDVVLSHLSSSNPQIKLSPEDLERCRNLMTGIMEYFTPVLFTPPATPHMACTDVFADKWMPLVIQHALGNDSVYKPLETLETIKDIDWAAQGLCGVCVEEKRGEWTQEQRDIWEKVDGWLKDKI
ncbi:hypothetical protein SERLA73DRAFT_60590 [Serpula lacrymans var. lacrymans S7.3]|uniref:BTB domain-containing protein n=2 Tax=Serpula lacrymans var. lacrymans TaxID=341189 RepID=F8Q884_SERL3|nr:uncharacterized protein SERLADRAFT_373098 [Serpula lacrymans var. lacrymans S7.9]EGN95772.1 hypothetical protein SERLA73DRAFT_60590 [Serpula lacrymans var. lacrymans S7.3]EGO21295.1 hypothetical protein SERLADRAFT_373098 [Serpula lacrymans var. lacrymans S7.9]